MLTDIQQWWIQEHDYMCRIDKASKQSMCALFAMYERYSALTILEKKEINDLLITWVDQSDVGNVNSDELYTALACITEFEILAAIPSMERLCVRLMRCEIPEDPQGYNKRELILRKLQVLKQNIKCNEIQRN